MNELQNILKTIKQNEKYDSYTEYNLSTYIDIKNEMVKNIINNLNKNLYTKCFYNKKTLICDNIGVVDIDGIRYIDFDDNIFTMLNKGIDYQIDTFIN